MWDNYNLIWTSKQRLLFNAFIIFIRWIFLSDFACHRWQLNFLSQLARKCHVLSELEALNCSVPGKYSILSQLSDIFNNDRKFEFITECPSPSYNFRWRQSNNPISEPGVSVKRSSDGFESIHNGTNNPLIFWY